jgi:aspartyl-tRNA(Asn)/glutamyl-tRNA(Gln) amidotransferase subunit C
MQIDQETLRKLAHLARLEIKPEDEPALLKDLSNMITFVEKLKEVDTTGVEPLTTMSHEVNRWRTDEVGPHLTRQEALQNAPVPDPDYFRVPKVLE